jgi:hypothetical protein
MGRRASSGCRPLGEKMMARKAPSARTGAVRRPIRLPVAKGGEAPPFGIPGNCGRSPRPPLFRLRSVVEAWLRCPLKVTVAQPATGPKPPLRRSWGAAGGPEARRSERPTAGGGERKQRHLARGCWHGASPCSTGGNMSNPAFSSRLVEAEGGTPEAPPGNPWLQGPLCCLRSLCSLCVSRSESVECVGAELGKDSLSLQEIADSQEKTPDVFSVCNLKSAI